LRTRGGDLFDIKSICRIDHVKTSLSLSLGSKRIVEVPLSEVWLRPPEEQDIPSPLAIIRRLRSRGIAVPVSTVHEWRPDVAAEVSRWLDGGEIGSTLQRRLSRHQRRAGG
jgi:hypothetical protein